MGERIKVRGEDQFYGRTKRKQVGMVEENIGPGA
jgi:hypothetical protein